MPKPTTKQELIDAAEKEYAALEKLLTTIPAEEMITPGALGDWSVKDVLAHLFAWQDMLFGWYKAGLTGAIPAVPAEGYKWSDMPRLNQHIQQKYQAASLADVLDTFHASHARTVELIASLSEEDLFTPGKCPWMNRNTLAAYCNSTAGAHYRWARTELRAWRNKS